ncbi:OprD family outer membrane porin [Sulfurimonas sp.]
MNKIIKISLVTSLLISASYAADSVNSINDMFANGKVSGQVRLGYIKNSTSVAASKDTSATAVGGQLKYETAAYHGLSLGAAMYTSNSISSLSGDDKKAEYNEDLASSEKDYTELAEAYVNYSSGGLNIRAGRQLIDTPLADSDDIRMTPHTFEAYVISYAMNNFTFIGANVRSWQGVDAGYANVTGNTWPEVGTDNEGVWMGAALYSNDMIEAGAWYYDVGNLAKAFYVDAVMPFKLSDNLEVVVGAQYLDEDELKNDAGAQSGIEGSVVGLMAESSVNDFGLSLAYNKADTKDTKNIFGGYGGGPFFTNMDTMTADNLTTGYSDATSIVVGMSYTMSGIEASVAYGDFKADAIAGGVEAHVTELDIGLAYSYNEGEADFTLMYVIGDDKKSSTKTSYDDSHIQITGNYNF